MSKYLRIRSGAENVNTEDYLAASLEIYDWIEKNSVRGNAGKYYRVNPGGPSDYSSKPVHGIYGMYSGSAGTGFLLLRLYEVTQEEKYLREAVEVMDELMANVRGKDFYEEKLATALNSDLKVAGWHTGVYSGPSGAGILAMELYKFRPDRRYLSFAEKAGEDILSVSRKTADGYTLTGDLDEFSDGGFVLYFISLYRLTGNEAYLADARAFAGYIYSKRQEDGQGGEFYYANVLDRVGMPKGSIYPGFSHGTAGIGYLFAVLYEADRQKWELEAAENVAQFLYHIADDVGDSRLTPYIYGGEHSEAYQGKHYLGFCHGPVGISLLYLKLYELTKKSAYFDFVLTLTRGLINSGAPEYNSWGLWNSYCMCCGVPGMIEHFVRLYEITGEQKYYEYARRSAARTIADSSETDGGRTFFGYWDRTDPRDVQAYTGLYSGAAGDAVSLLRMYACDKGIRLTPTWEYSYL